MAPRPSRGTISTRAPAAPSPRAIVRDFAGGQTAPLRIEFDVRPVFDFVFSLSDDAGSTEDLPAADRRWLTEARGRLDERTRADLAGLFGTELCVSVATLVVDRPEVRDAAAFVELVASADPKEAFMLMAGETAGRPDLQRLLGRALDGDEAAIAEVGTQFKDWHREERLALIRDPKQTIGRLVGVLRAWFTEFAPIEDRVRSMIEHDYAARRRDLDLPPADLIEKTTGGIRFLSEPGVRRVILAPSYFARPYNFHFAGGDWRMFGYPIADSALDGADPLAPPLAVVRLHRALGDETRLRILRLLRDRDWYLTEIAQQLELSKPTIKHHLAQLRAAGLVTLTEEGGLSWYSLRRQRLDDASTELKRFVVDS